MDCLQWIGQARVLLHRVWTLTVVRRERPGLRPPGRTPDGVRHGSDGSEPQRGLSKATRGAPAPSGLTDCSSANMMIRWAALYSGLQADSTSRS